MLKNLFRLASDKLFVISESQNEVLDLESPESICIPRFSDPPYTYRGHLNQKREIMFCNTGNCYTLEDGENWTQTTFKESRSQFTIGKTGRGQSMIVGGIGGMSGPYFVNSVEILTDGQWTTFEKDWATFASLCSLHLPRYPRRLYDASLCWRPLLHRECSSIIFQRRDQGLGNALNLEHSNQ